MMMMMMMIGVTCSSLYTKVKVRRAITIEHQRANKAYMSENSPDEDILPGGGPPETLSV